MLATETTAIVARLNMGGLLPVRDPAVVQVWHEDIGHLDYAVALEAARWLGQHRSSQDYGQVKTGDFLDAVKRVRRDRIEELLGNAPIPAPPAELDEDPRAGVRWQQAWTRAAGDGLTLDAATAVADQALGVVRREEITRLRPVAQLLGQVGRGVGE